MFSDIEEPTKCPSCESTLFKVVDQLFCKNITCPAQISAKVLHFCKTLSIKGMGPKTIEKLNINNCLEIFYIELNDIVEILGEKISTKLLDEINKARDSDLATVIEAFSIPLIGKVASQKLAEKLKNIDDINYEIAKSAGLGDKAIQNLLLWKETEWQELREFSPFNFEKVTLSKIPDNFKTVCITGKLKNYTKKEDAKQILLDHGYVLVDSVTKSLDVLVDEEGGNSSKRQKAEKYNIKIVNDLNDLIRK